MQRAGKYNTEFYPQISGLYSDSLSTEIMMLQKTIILPYVNEEYSCYKLMEAYNTAECEYRVPEEWYTDVLANFYPTMLTPMVKDGDSTLLIHNAPDVSNILTVGGEFVTTEYKEQNFIELVIPKSLVLLFRKEIPKGTKFTCNFTGGSTMYRSIKITGIASEIKNELDENTDETGLIMKPYKALTWEECVAEAGGEEMVPFWLMDRVEERITEWEEAVEKVGEVLEDKVEQQKEVRANKTGEITYS